MSEQGSKMQRYAIVGMKHRGAEALVASLPPNEPMTLIREPGNKFDKNAVQVWARGRHVGYVPKTQNAVLAQFIDQFGIIWSGPETALVAADGVARSYLCVNARLHLGSNVYPLVEIV